MQPLTKRQAEVLHYVMNHITLNGFAPTVREIADEFGFRSQQSAHDLLRRLEYKEYIVVEWRKSRAVQVLRDPIGYEVRLRFIGATKPRRVGKLEVHTPWVEKEQK